MCEEGDLCSDLFEVVSCHAEQVFPTARLSGGPLVTVCRFVPVPSLLSFRRVARTWRSALSETLQRDQPLEKSLQAHLDAVMSGSSDKRVWVAVRARPQGDAGCFQVKRNRVTMLRPDQGDAGRPGSASKEGHSSFFFNAAFDGSATQSQVWSQLAPKIMRCMHRTEHACLLAYGQTGSGKTHTMFGNPTVAGEEGVAFRAMHMISHYLLQERDNADAAWVPEVEFSFLEVYNEKVNDLLNGQAPCPLSYHRTIVEQGGKYSCPKYANDERLVPQGLVRRACELNTMASQVASWLTEGASSRITGRTVFNPQSSRSHAVATLHIKWTPVLPDRDLPRPTSANGAKPLEVRVYLVDLAGSERAGQYALSQEQLREGVNINRSLSTLGRVVGALAKGKGECVPYRESTLTWLLSDAITGVSARAFMIAAVQPAHPAETLSTLQYAQAYSNLQSDLSWKIPQTLTLVRNLQHNLASQKNEFQRLLCDFGCSHRIWNVLSLNERLVRTHRSAQDMFRGHPMLAWTDAHDTKLAIRDVGVVREVSAAPLPRQEGEALDGRRKTFKPQVHAGPEDTVATDLAEEASAEPAPVGLESALTSMMRVEYPGKHGRPSTFLWYPATALLDVRPPQCLRDLLRKCEQTEATLHDKRELLKDLQAQFAQQQQQWMGADEL